jgi:biotin carboxylase
MDLKGKKLLLLGSSTSTVEIINYAKEMGVYTIVADYLNESPAKAVADESLLISTAEIYKLASIVKEMKIDAVFAGASEFNIESAMKVCKLTEIYFYATEEQFRLITNKKNFKQLCRRHGIPVINEYNLDNSFSIRDLECIKYPVLIKPADSSSGLGITICYNEIELKEGYLRAQSYSKSRTAIIEDYLENMMDIDVYYTVQDGYFSLSAMVDRYLTYEQDKLTPLPIGYIFPSIHLDKYIERYHSKVIKMFESIGIKNGIFDIGGYTNGEEFFFYEASYRIWGSKTELFIEKNNGINVLKMMVNLSLTGKMIGWDVKKHDNPYFKQHCCCMLFPVLPGKVERIDGLDEIKKMPEVFNITNMHNVGDTIELSGSLRQLLLRIYLCANDKEKLIAAINKINSLLRITSVEGKDMRMKWFKYQ